MFPNDVIRSLELTNVDIIRNKEVMDFIFSLIYHSPYKIIELYNGILFCYYLRSFTHILIYE